MSNTPATRFVRSTSDRYLTGVCGGLGAYFGVDSNIVRLVMVLATLFLPGPGWIIYPGLWLAMPTDAGGPSGFQQLRSMLENNRRSVR
ncbi:PspC domain-containing protein [Nigerium massiliense]|uniref:PspC domain-containing protein n=1 Tax=Nigerium massiliense TaxID=1522317 RepID=UPI000907BDEA|nr:PspC domain-containing protein [Nigerium massiliense]